MSSPLIESFDVAATLLSQRIMSQTTATAWAVKYPASAAEVAFGVSVDTVIDATCQIPVQITGVAKILFNQTVAVGALVASDSSGRGVVHTDVTAGSYYIGTLLETVNATGTIAKVLINPGVRSIP